MQPPNPLFSGVTRKQNVACDACRAKKIRCKRLTTAEPCEQCTSKDIECTSNYIEQLQSKPRRPRRFRSGEDRENRDDRPGPSRSPAVAPAPTISQRPTASGTEDEANGASPAPRFAMDDAMTMITTWMAPGRARAPADPATAQLDLLRYLFNPTPVLHHDWRYSDVAALDQGRAGTADLWEEQGGVWDEAPSAAHVGLWAGGESELEGLALELIDSFFTIVDSRIPILDPSFMARFQNPTVDAPPHALLAVVLAFGAKFSEHASLVADREECSARETEGRSRSRLAQLLVIRAREVVETNKVHRVAALPNVQTLLLLEALLGQSPVLKRRYRASYLANAGRHLEELQTMLLCVETGVKDEKIRAELALYMMAGIEAALFRLTPSNLGFITDYAPILAGNGDDDTWLHSARAGASIYRKLSSELWNPHVAANGIPLSVLRDFVHDHSSWRDLYLAKVGFQVPLPDSWDFATSVKAASTDIFYHALWLVADRAVRDFGINEAADGPTRGMFAFEVASMRERLKGEALHSALRIAMVTAVSTEQGFLRLDPLVLYRPIYDAGLHLARLGRDDCLGCVMGLKQYAAPYPQMWDLAVEIETMLAKNAAVQQLAPQPDAVMSTHAILA